MLFVINGHSKYYLLVIFSVKLFLTKHIKNWIDKTYYLILFSTLGQPNKELQTAVVQGFFASSTIYIYTINIRISIHTYILIYT